MSKYYDKEVTRPNIMIRSLCVRILWLGVDVFEYCGKEITCPNIMLRSCFVQKLW